MIKRYLQTIVAVSLLNAAFIHVAEATENRCGWLQNPTPSNWWLTDADGDWIISSQGGDSIDDNSWNKVPEFNDNEFVKTNGSYGYGCACLSVTVDKGEHRILKVHGGKQLPLKQCEDDRSLPSVAQ